MMEFVFVYSDCLCLNVTTFHLASRYDIVCQQRVFKQTFLTPFPVSSPLDWDFRSCGLEVESVIDGLGWFVLVLHFVSRGLWYGMGWRWLKWNSPRVCRWYLHLQPPFDWTANTFRSVDLEHIRLFVESRPSFCFLIFFQREKARLVWYERIRICLLAWIEAVTTMIFFYWAWSVVR